MPRPSHAAVAVVLLGLLVAGCSTTRDDPGYSSLPTSPRLPEHAVTTLDESTGTAVAKQASGADVTPAPAGPPDLLDRIRAGYALPDVQHYSVDR